MMASTKNAYEITDTISDIRFPTEDAIWYTDNDIFCRTYVEEPVLPIDDIIKYDLVQILLNCVRKTHHRDLWADAARTLVKMTAGSARHIDTVVSAGACPLFIDLLESDDAYRVYAAVRALTNIASGGRHLRDLLIQLDAVSQLTKLALRDVNGEFLLRIVRCFRRLVDDTTALGYPDIVTTCLPTIRHFLLHEHRGVAVEACAWMAEIAGNMRKGHVQQAVELGIVSCLVDMIRWGHGSTYVSSAVDALYRVNNASQIVVEHGALYAYRKVLERGSAVGDSRVVISVLVALAEEDAEWLAAVIDTGLVPILVDLLRSGDADIREEATVTVCKLIYAANDKQIVVFLKGNVLSPLVNIVNSAGKTDFIGVAAMFALTRLGRAYKKKFKAYWRPLKRCYLLWFANSTKKRIGHLSQLNAEMAKSYQRLKQREQAETVRRFKRVQHLAVSEVYW